MAEELTYAETLPDVSGHVIFSDDLRFENTGKLLVVGMYSGAMFIHGGFPATIKSFAIFINYIERIGSQTAPVKIEVLFPGMEAPFAQIPLPIEEVRSRDDKDPLGKKGNFHMISFPLVVGPVAIPGSGTMIVLARVGDKPFRLGALAVAEQPPLPPPPQTKEAAS